MSINTINSTMTQLYALELRQLIHQNKFTDNILNFA